MCLVARKEKRYTKSWHGETQPWNGHKSWIFRNKRGWTCAICDLGSCSVVTLLFFYQSIQGCGVSHSCQFTFLCGVISSPVVLLEYFMFSSTAYSTTALWVSFLYLLMKLWLKDIIIYCLSHPHLLFVFLRLPERRLETTVTLFAVVMMYCAR